MIKLVLAGSHHYTWECYQALHAMPGVQIVGVVPNPQSPSATELKVGNKNTLFQVPKQFVDVPTLSLDQLSTVQADVLLSVMYSQILTSDQLHHFPQGAWNIHPGILPQYRGRNVLYWTIMNGAARQGFTFHRMTAELDAGDILETVTYAVQPTDTVEDLFIRAKQLIGHFAQECIRQVMTGDYQLRPNDLTKSQLYTTQSVDFTQLQFDAQQFHTFTEASRQLRALLFPSLQQFPTMRHGQQSVTIHSVADLAQLVTWFRERVVLADGCMDPLHEGHMAYLEAAKALGDRLVVNTVTDEEIWQKRPTIGPFLPAASRLAVLRGLRAVDEVITMDTLEALRTIRPNVYAKGKDWDGRLPEAEVKLCQELGIEIRYLDTVQNSSTALLKKFVQQVKDHA